MDPAKASIRAMKASELTAGAMARIETKLDTLLAALQLHDSESHADQGDDGPEDAPPAHPDPDPDPDPDSCPACPAPADLIPVRNRSHKKKVAFDG
jgi:hypothetical protein